MTFGDSAAPQDAGRAAALDAVAVQNALIKAPA
jgi:hypothetical protein